MLRSVCNCNGQATCHVWLRLGFNFRIFCPWSWPHLSMLLALAAMMNRLHGLTRWPHRQRHVLVRQLGSLSAEREECEDLVIGAGVVGICAAYSLARQGRRVKVLDQGSGPAQGSSWINGTLICPSLMLPGSSQEFQNNPFLRPKLPLSPKAPKHSSKLASGCRGLGLN